jgi:hypothetical protein
MGQANPGHVRASSQRAGLQLLPLTPGEGQGEGKSGLQSLAGGFLQSRIANSLTIVKLLTIIGLWNLDAALGHGFDESLGTGGSPMSLTQGVGTGQAELARGPRVSHGQGCWYPSTILGTS